MNIFKTHSQKIEKVQKQWQIKQLCAVKRSTTIKTTMVEHLQWPKKYQPSPSLAVRGTMESCGGSTWPWSGLDFLIITLH